MKHSSLLVAAASLALLLPATPLLAQDNPPPGGSRGRFDPEQFRKMMADRMKQSMKTTDEEWSVLEPMITNVVEKQMAARGGFGRGLGGPPRDASSSSSSNPGGSSKSGSDSTRTSRYPQPAEVEALRTTLEKDDAPKEELKARLEAIRAQKKRAQQELEDARAQLAKVVTVRQEAVLVAFGILE
jgi:hypothetical protein